MSSPIGDMRGNASYDPFSRRGNTSSRLTTANFEVELLPNWKRDVYRKSGMLIALVVGMLMVVAVRAIRFHASGTALISDKPEITTAIEAGGAVVLSFLVFLLFPFRGLKYVILLLVGIGISVTTMHNVVHSKPDVFSMLFSPDWTARVVAETEPNSLYFLGKTTPLVPEKKEEKKMPTVRRLN